MIEQDTVLSYN